MRVTQTLLPSFAGLLITAFLAAGSVPVPTPTYDPLATPVLSDHPTTEELGASVYYNHCMPCHGDQGQGLTDAFRGIWEEDHQNCWGRGCHAGRPKDEGFFIPTVVPAVMAAGDALPNYLTPQQLYDYLETTHPPQEPGRLGDEDTWALVALLWEGNGKPAMQPTALPATPSLSATVTPRPATATPPSPPTQSSSDGAPISVCGVSLFVPVITVTGAVLGRKRKQLT